MSFSAMMLAGLLCAESREMTPERKPHGRDNAQAGHYLCRKRLPESGGEEMADGAGDVATGAGCGTVSKAA
jgi:hypothetical protein